MAIQNGRVMYNTSGVQNPLLIKKSVKTTRNGGQRSALDYTLCVPDENVRNHGSMMIIAISIRLMVMKLACL